jgi:ATP/maltotriose-dependent transcriptional regulator MalT
MLRGMPVLATKLFAPARRDRLVARPRLAGRLDGILAAGHRLTLVSAPAGFGKTTLLGDWLAHLGRARVAWLSLDAGDNDLERLLAHLVAGLRAAGLPVADGPVLAALVNHVPAAGEQWVLVLDDYHVIEAAEVHEAVTFLLDHLPGHLRLLIATRADPPLPLARLRARGELTELRAADLRFTVAEAREFLNQVMGLDLTAGAVMALEARTEGWIAGLQLAALSLRDIPAPGAVDGFIAAFTGSHRFVLDYLADEVLARQPAARRDFLLRTAVLDRLTGPLADAVTGRTDGARTLVELDRGNLFLVPLDDDRSWYRYHHLFAEVLRARLVAERPGLPPELHRRAADWYAAHDLPADAVRHAMAAGDHARAAYLIEEALPGMRRTRQDSLTLAWIRALPAEVARRSPVLSILSGWALMLAGDLDAAADRLDAAERALTADPAVAATWADTDDLRTAPATIAIYRAALCQARGDVAGTVRHARHALGLAGPGDHLVRGAAGGFLGLAAWAGGDVREALAVFGAAVRSLHAAGNLVDELDSTVVLADMWVAAGRPGRARRLYEQALRSATGGGEPYPRATADLHVGLAELDRELGDLPAAEAHLETARVLAERGSITENRHRWFVVKAQLAADPGEAERLLDEAEAVYRPGFYPDLRPIAAMRARVRIAAGDLAGAAAWAEGRGDGTGYPSEYADLTVVRLRLAQRRPAAARELLDRLHAAALGTGRDGSLLEIRTLRAVTLDAQGDHPAAAAALARARAEAPEPDSYVRLFLEAAPGPAAELLSPRELEVLRLLDSELTGPEIARRLYVSINTLRTHTKRIFTKLGATTRAAAVRRARDRGLLSFTPGSPDDVTRGEPPAS